MRLHWLKIVALKLRTAEVLKSSLMMRSLQWVFGVVMVMGVGAASAGVFDEDARKEVAELRQRVETLRSEADQKLIDQTRRTLEENAQFRRSLLDLQNQIEAVRADSARLRGQNEQLVRDLTDVQRQQKDATQSVEERLRKFEPAKVSVDGRDFLAEPVERREFEAALATFRKGDFASAQLAFVDFLKRFPQSGYGPSSLFWLGNAQYATRDYKEAVINFRSLLTLAPDHVRSPEAVLSIANCQVELKDVKGARKTLEDLLKAYPQTEAAIAAKDRLSRLK
jgi:tol-pal system protein YbgF